MANFEIIEREGLHLVKVILQNENETVRTESGALYYMRGKIVMESKPPSAGGFLKALATAIL
ncbi:MAG TPA: AIM24 family protein [Nostocaceae cyanobacterium]|nr:AIM24 family protein [Nostocaceae cyanobacterium]